MALFTCLVLLLVSPTLAVKLNDTQTAYRCFDVRDYNFEAAAVKALPITEDDIGFSQFKCAHECVSMDTKCDGFHLDDSGMCYLLKAGKSWKELYSAEEKQICMIPGRGNPKCNKTTFPEKFGRSRYAYFSEKKSWRDAAKACERLDSKLLQITTLPEVEYIKQNYISLGESTDADHREMTDFIQAGALQLPGTKKKEKNWVYHRSGDDVLPQVWSQGEPNWFGGRQSVGAIKSDGLLDDNFQNALHPSICECFII